MDRMRGVIQMSQRPRVTATGRVGKAQKAATHAELELAQERQLLLREGVARRR